uniref:Neuropeptide-Like Protein n=1 Tax=Caenorhabditis tropicalis TaxID=1561998 RepID=A0A1I7V3M0_9PELO
MSSWLRTLFVFFIVLVVSTSALPSDYVRFLIQSARNQENSYYPSKDVGFMRVNRNQGAGSVSLDSLASLPMLRYG